MTKRRQWGLQNHPNLGGCEKQPGQGPEQRLKPWGDNLDTSMCAHTALSVMGLMSMVPDSNEDFGDIEM